MLVCSTLKQWLSSQKSQLLLHVVVDSGGWTDGHPSFERSPSGWRIFLSGLHLTFSTGAIFLDERIFLKGQRRKFRLRCKKQTLAPLPHTACTARQDTEGKSYTTIGSAPSVTMAFLFKTYSPVLVPKQIMGLHGDSMEGMPNGALGYVGEGSILKRKGQYDPLIFPVTEALKAKGISTEDWEAICTMLKAGQGSDRHRRRLLEGDFEGQCVVL